MDTLTAPPSQRRDFQFSGNAAEYFGIWVVNILLTLVTLGIYSAWAKVRTKQYFYGHTRVADSPFDYTGDPLAILKGRLIAALVLVAYWMASQVSLYADALFNLLLIVVVPWLVVRGLMFNARNSRWRNVSFDFNGRYGDAIKAYVGWPLLALLTLGILSAHMLLAQARLLAERSAFGRHPFNYHATVGDYYRVLAGGLLVLIGVGVVVGTVVALFTTFYPMDAVTLESKDEAIFYAGVITALTLIPLALGYLVLYSYFKATLGNLFWRSLDLGGLRFESRLGPIPLVWLYASNMVAVMASVGLLIPWARVRLTRYRVSCLTLLDNGRLDELVGAERERIKATGEELADMLDMDFGL